MIGGLGYGLRNIDIRDLGKYGVIAIAKGVAMTLVVAMKAQDAIVLAADSRGTIGDPRGLTAINDSHTKIFSFGRCGLATAGATEIGAALLDELRKQNLDTDQNVDELASAIAAECAGKSTGWFRDIPPDKRPGVLLTLAGYRQVGNGAPEPMIFLLTSNLSFAPQLAGDFPMLSGVPQYAVYLMHRYYDPTISAERAKALAHHLIAETASQDPKVGGPIRMAVITPDAGFTEIEEPEIQQIQGRNLQMMERMRQFFLTGDAQ